MKKYMTKKEAVKYFRENILPGLIREYGKNDKPAVDQAWNDWTDSLCKDGIISSKQYNTWTHPF